LRLLLLLLLLFPTFTCEFQAVLVRDELQCLHKLVHIGSIGLFSREAVQGRRREQRRHCIQGGGQIAHRRRHDTAWLHWKSLTVPCQGCCGGQRARPEETAHGGEAEALTFALLLLVMGGE
jgi:hypothetical protein